MSNQEKILELCQELSYITDICVSDFLDFIDKNCGDYSGEYKNKIIEQYKDYYKE